MPRGVFDDEIKCQGTSRQSGNKCQKVATPGSKWCHLHGSRIPKGADSPHFKHGQTSRYMPERLLDRYHEILNDDKLLESRDEVAICKSRVQEIIEGVDEGASAEKMKELKKLKRTFQAASRKGEETDAKMALEDMFSLIEDMNDDYRAWEEAGQWMQRAVKIREAEVKRMKDEQKMVTAEEVMVLVTALRESVVRHVQERADLHAIQTDFNKFVSVGHQGAREPSAN